MGTNQGKYTLTTPRAPNPSLFKAYQLSLPTPPGQSTVQPQSGGADAGPGQPGPPLVRNTATRTNTTVRVLIMPHPSGVSHFWSFPDNFTKARFAIARAMRKAGLCASRATFMHPFPTNPFNPEDCQLSVRARKSEKGSTPSPRKRVCSRS